MASRKTTAKTDRSDWISRMRESSHDVFLAGLASLARARSGKKQPGKVDFESLVAEGRKLEPEMKESFQKAVDEWREKSRASMTFTGDSKLQKVFEERVASVLTQLGVPTSKEIADLRSKVEQLIAGKAGGQGRRRAAKPPAKAATKSGAKAAPKTLRRSARKAVKKTASAK